MTDAQWPVAGRKTNGLAAASWAAVAEVDPRQGAELLAALAAAGIAAYTVPSSGFVGGYLERRLPPRPVDRLHVDASRRRDAEAVLRAELDPDDSGLARTSTLTQEEDAAFAAIVAGWDTRGLDRPVNPWPVNEDAEPIVPHRERDAPSPPEPDAPRRRRLGMGSRRRGTEPDDPEDHYHPPPPPPAPRPRGRTLISLLAILAGIACIVVVSIKGYGDSLPLVAGVVLVVVGVGGLLTGMRDGDDGDGWDAGAVV